MGRIEWVDAALGRWAIWAVDGRARVGGYASPMYDPNRVAQTADVRAGMGVNDPELDGAAFEMDRAIAALPEELIRAVKAAYTWEGGRDVIANKLRITRATLHRRLCNADIRIVEWFDLRKQRAEMLAAGAGNYATYT